MDKPYIPPAEAWPYLPPNYFEMSVRERAGALKKAGSEMARDAFLDMLGKILAVTAENCLQS